MRWSAWAASHPRRKSWSGRALDEAAPTASACGATPTGRATGWRGGGRAGGHDRAPRGVRCRRRVSDAGAPRRATKPVHRRGARGAGASGKRHEALLLDPAYTGKTWRASSPTCVSIADAQPRAVRAVLGASPRPASPTLAATETVSSCRTGSTRNRWWSTSAALPVGRGSSDLFKRRHLPNALTLRARRQAAVVMRRSLRGAWLTAHYGDQSSSSNSARSASGNRWRPR